MSEGRAMKDVKIGDVVMDGVQPVFLLGPCVIESEAFVWEMARALKAIADEAGARWVFKASYDKANRTSIHSFRGPGMDAGLETLRHVREKFDVPALTDIHTISQVDTVSHSVEILQIPAFLCRQTDLLVAAAEAREAMTSRWPRHRRGDRGRVTD